MAPHSASFFSHDSKRCQLKAATELDPWVREFDTVAQAIEFAEALLPGKSERGIDPRWQAIVQIGHFISSDPEDIWSFIAKWGGHEDDDLRDAIACVLLEHLLELQFELIFPRVRAAADCDKMFADMFCRCWKFGQSETPENTVQFDALQNHYRI